MADPGGRGGNCAPPPPHPSKQNRILKMGYLRTNSVFKCLFVFKGGGGGGTHSESVPTSSCGPGAVDTMSILLLSYENIGFSNTNSQGHFGNDLVVSAKYVLFCSFGESKLYIRIYTRINNFRKVSGNHVLKLGSLLYGKSSRQPKTDTGLGLGMYFGISDRRKETPLSSQHYIGVCLSYVVLY